MFELFLLPPWSAFLIILKEETILETETTAYLDKQLENVLQFTGTKEDMLQPAIMLKTMFSRRYQLWKAATSWGMVEKEDFPSGQRSGKSLFKFRKLPLPVERFLVEYILKHQVDSHSPEVQSLLSRLTGFPRGQIAAWVSKNY